MQRNLSLERARRLWTWLWSVVMVTAPSVLPLLADDARDRASFLAEPLTRVAAIHALPKSQADLGLPVRLELVTTVLDREWSLTFGQDGSGGIYLMPVPPSWAEPGMRLRVTGRTRSGEQHHVVVDADYTLLRQDALPAPREIAAADLHGPALDAQWVEITGKVRATYLTGNRGSVILQCEDRVLEWSSVKLRDAAGLPALDATVRARGVALLREGSSGTGAAKDFWLIANSEADLTLVLPPSAAPYARPASPISELISSGATRPSGRVHVQGQIVEIIPGSFLVLSNDTGVIRVETRQMGGGRPGDDVEAVGFLAPGGAPAVLVDANYRPRTPRETGRSLSGREELPVLTRIRDILDLSSSEAARGYPVSLQAGVSFCDPEARTLFVQDGSAGIFVYRAPGISSLRKGQRLKLRGFTAKGLYANIVASPTAEVLPGVADLVPLVASGPSLASGVHDAQYVSFLGVLQSIEPWEWVTNRSPYLVLRLGTGQQVVRLAIPQGDRLTPPRDWVDRQLTVNGVSGALYDEENRLQEILVWAQDLAEVKPVEGPAPAAFETPLRPLEELLPWKPAAYPPHRVRVRGTLTLARSGELLVIQDGPLGLSIRTAISIPARLGDQVEVAAFPNATPGGLLLDHAQVRSLGPGAPVAPARVTAVDLEARSRQSLLVTLEGKLLSWARLGKGTEFLLESEGRLIRGDLGLLQESFAAALPEAGSWVQLTGVYAPMPTGWSRTAPRTVWLRSEHDVRVLRHPPWLTARRAIIIAAVASGAGLVAWLWGFLLRRQVKEQTGQIRRSLEQEQSLLVAKDRAEAASAAKSQFLANMSHEIRTPLNGLMGMLQILRRTELHPKQQRLVQNALFSSEALLGVIGDILDFSRIEAGRLELEEFEFSPADWTETIQRMFGPRAEEKGLELTCALAPEVPRVLVGDAHRGRQVLVNLVGNALKFTEAGGVHVGIDVEAVFPDGVMLRVAVKDSGCGIAAEDHERIFDAFSQVDESMTRRRGGTGLGLSISRQLCRLMGGDIGVESAPGEGSTFWFTVRLKSVDAARLAPGTITTTAALQPVETSLIPPSNPPSPKAASRPTVLVAEDNEINREFVREILGMSGFTCECVNDGMSAVKLMAVSEVGQFQVILMDCQMPKMDGYEATRTIRRWESVTGRTRVPIIALTAHAMQGDRERCLEAGMDDYLTKPLDPQLLLEALARWEARPSAL